MQKIAVLLGVPLLIAFAVWWGMARRETAPAGTELPVRVAATFYPLAEFARAVGGERVVVTTVVPAGTEPHDYEPSPEDIAGIHRSRLFLMNGAGLDAWAERLVSDLAARDVTSLVMSAQFELRASDADAALAEHAFEPEATDAAPDHGYEGADPHLWLDPVLAEKQVIIIRDMLVVLDPAGREAYFANAAAYAEKLQALDDDYREGLEDCSKEHIVVAHDAFGYLADRYGFGILPVAGLSPEAEPSLERLAELASLMRSEGLRVVYFETLASPKTAETLAREVGATTLVLDPIEGLTAEQAVRGADYLSLAKANLEALRQGLECR